MLTRDTFLFLGLVSYLLGSLPLENFLQKICGDFSCQRWFRGLPSSLLPFLANLVKGAAAVFLARLLVGSPMAQVIAGLTVLAGHYWPFFARMRGSTGFAVLAGALVVLSPVVLMLLLLVWVAVYFSFEKPLAGHIACILALPIVLWQVKRFDLYILFGVLAAGMVGYRLLNEESGWRKRARRLLLLLLFCSLATAGFFNRYVYRGFGMQIDMIRSGNPELPFVAITFDDGPDPLYTPAILDILAAYNVKATFFMVGRHVEKYPEIARRIVEEGHDIGNHTHTHRSLVPLDPKKVYEEIVRCEEIILGACGRRPYLFRPPRGIYSQVVRDIAHAREYTLVLWSVSSQDWREISSREVTARILERVTGGDILLFHDSGNLISAQGGYRYNTVRALPKILAGLEKKGLVPVTMREMLIIKGLTHTEEEA